MHPVARQGDPDGLCGIYCLIAFMRAWGLHDSPTENDREAFRYLMRAAERLHILTADRLHDGYEAHELLEIFTVVLGWLREPYKAALLSEYKARYPNDGRIDALRKITEQGGAVVLSVDRHRHWVLVKSVQRDGKIIVDDPDGTVMRKTIEISDISTGPLGLVLLPASSKVMEA